jgi:hypothetical protein
MPKASLTFDLPEERAEFSAAVQGQDARILLWEIDQHCRNTIKYTDQPAAVRAALEEIRELIRQDTRVSLEE